ncbi:MAG: triosephosphate isomerase [Polaribacter sp.]|jgi:triosephosphate isomerase
MPRKKIAAGNWKMNTLLKDGLKLATAIAKKVPDTNKAEVVFGTPFTHLHAVAQAVKGNKKVKVAAQNCSANDSGAYTGETSVAMSKSVGASYIIVGHSERRMYHNETDKLLATKVDKVLAGKLKPIFCCGEPIDIRKAKKQKTHVAKQLRAGLFHLDEKAFKNVVIAYEPIWAIGTGLTASPEQAQEMHKYLRGLIAKKYGEKIANNTSILYGGSVKPGNAESLFSQPDVDGGLVGGASLDAKGFVEIINCL